MYKAIDNVGIYYELNLLIDYIEEDEDLELLNELLIDFKKEGLTQHDLSLAIELIEQYLPGYIECDSEGCYVNQDIEGISTHTYFSDLETELQENITKTLLVV
jgi:hypothetical protein